MLTIESLGTSRVHLYSLHLYNFSSGRRGVNIDVADFNNRIRSSVHEIPSTVYLDVYNSFIYEGESNPQLYYDKLHLSPYKYEILVLAKKLLRCRYPTRVKARNISGNKLFLIFMYSHIKRIYVLGLKFKEI